MLKFTLRFNILKPASSSYNSGQNSLGHSIVHLPGWLKLLLHESEPEVARLARFHVIIPFAFVMFTLHGGLTRLPSQPASMQSGPYLGPDNMEASWLGSRDSFDVILHEVS